MLGTGSVRAELVEQTCLSPLATPELVSNAAAETSLLGARRICVTPSLIASLAETDLLITSVCGFPGGKHHQLIKATEARFAVQGGASEIALVPDHAALATDDQNALLSEVITVREAVTDQVGLAVLIDASLISASALLNAMGTCARSGATRIILRNSESGNPEGTQKLEGLVRTVGQQAATRMPISAFAEELTLEEAQQLIEAGAASVGTNNIAQLLSP